MRARTWLVAPVLLALAGCTHTVVSPAQTVTVTAVPSPSDTASSPTAGSATPTPSPSKTSATPTSTPASVVYACQYTDLKVKLVDGGAAAGTVYYVATFTNVGAAACTLNGYPYVELVAPGTGKQVGQVGGFDHSRPPKSVKLTVGGTASAMLALANYGNFGASVCHPTTVSGFRLYAPNIRSAVYLPFATNGQACSGAVAELTVGPVVPGATGQ